MGKGGRGNFLGLLWGSLTMHPDLMQEPYKLCNLLSCSAQVTGLTAGSQNHAARPEVTMVLAVSREKMCPLSSPRTCSSLLRPSRYGRWG